MVGSMMSSQLKSCLQRQIQNFMLHKSFLKSELNFYQIILYNDHDIITRFVKFQIDDVISPEVIDLKVKNKVVYITLLTCRAITYAFFPYVFIQCTKTLHTIAASHHALRYASCLLSLFSQRQCDSHTFVTSPSIPCCSHLFFALILFS